MRLSLFGLLDRWRIPAPDARRVGLLTHTPFAHRGLHGSRIVENSRASVEAAITAGYGIEIDVQFSLDGMAFVFHDSTLDRMTEAKGQLRHYSGKQLREIRLRGSDETIPSLGDILAIVNGRVPVLVELKTIEGHVAQLCVAVRHALETYRGEVAVMSINGEVSRWFAGHGSRITRGLIMSDSNTDEEEDGVEQAKLVWRAQPEFLAIDINDLPNRYATRMRKRGVPVLSWTIRSAEQQAIAAEHADQIIFEAPGW